MRLAIEERGADPVLAPHEQEVYDAILREQRLPGGGFRLVDPPPAGNESLPGAHPFSAQSMAVS